MPATGNIQVYALFPHTITLSADRYASPSNWHWVHCLTLPLKTLAALQFSQRQYKWIRYSIGIVVGSEGDLSSSPNIFDVMDYNASLPTKSTNLYYHTSNEERQRMFPADPNNGHTKITSSVATNWRTQFHDDVAGRDGEACADCRYCDAVHLLPPSKGDGYITRYTQRRSQDSAGEDISLGHQPHILNGETPNFAMTTSDIDPTAPPTQRRCTAHAFELGDSFALGNTSMSSGTQIRVSDTPEWPPAIIFDAVYASTVVHHFGNQKLKDEVNATWKDKFYPDGITTMAQAAYKGITDERASARERTRNQAQDREARFDVRRGLQRGLDRGPDILNFLTIMPYVLVPWEERLSVMGEVEEKAQAADQTCMRDKVENWMKAVDAP
ncbi:hypothetical protein FA15DRAFT_705047 [Coprinopsis marcescibilis]|uniref:HNH nuclease domain-containing protein n=1 Tax=Coprinopsis marcescibilis TaxID=230819 RepID=A0A5C3KTV1_COPMA|nr:hypothetical protein FA15DRAFT_705047 [Coprinopsis marcescibilis]